MLSQGAYCLLDTEACSDQLIWGYYRLSYIITGVSFNYKTFVTEPKLSSFLIDVLINYSMSLEESALGV